MALSLLYILFAILGLGFLVFIHELGHYWVARKKGMKVEAFSIGFGRPIYTWERDGVQWRICWLLFGGYVKIIGMQKEGSQEPYEVPEGYYSKSPLARIQVSLAGPLVNIVFAFLAFGALWLLGGRDKPFSEFTHHIGWVDPNSALYQEGVRPGDVLQTYDGRPFQGFKDLLLASVMKDKAAQIEGYKVDYLTGTRSEFDYTLATYTNPNSPENQFRTIGILSPAQYMIFDPQKGFGGPTESGMQPGDRILWVDGEVVFSPQQLSSLTNESSAFLTVKRGTKVFQTKVPRVQLEELRLTPPERGEVDDWQHEAGLKGRLQDLYFLPYNISPTLVVEGQMEFIDEADQAKAFGHCQRCTYFTPLQEGDRILAIDGTPVQTAFELLDRIQVRRVLIIVDRNPSATGTVAWNRADQSFADFSSQDLEAMVARMGTDQPLFDAGTLRLLKPIVPKPLMELPLSAAQKALQAGEFARIKAEIEKIPEGQARSDALRQLETQEKRLMLGLSFRDRVVRYNPNPFVQFADSFKDIARTLSGLVFGGMSSKYLAGPVGMIQIAQQSWELGVKEALFWMAVISLNLGLLNLLPIPVLDGGHIVFALYESVTKKRIKAKTMERLIIPFLVLLGLFFLYVTYHDLARLFSRFF